MSTETAALLDAVKELKEDSLDKLVKELEQRPKNLDVYKKLTRDDWKELYGPASIFVFNHLNPGNAVNIASNDVLASTLQSLVTKVNDIQIKQEPIFHFIEEFQSNQFMLLAESTKSDNNAIKLSAYNFYNSSSLNILPSTIKCFLLDIHFPQYQVTCSHLFQKRWNNFIQILDLKFIDDPQNIVFLFKPIEIAFDHGKIIFLWNNASQSFVLHILDPCLLDKTVLELTLQLCPSFLFTLPLPENESIIYRTFEELAGSVLNFPGSAIAYKRCFAFHAKRAIYEAVYVKKWNINVDKFSIEEEAWSPNIKEKPNLKAIIDKWMVESS